MKKLVRSKNNRVIAGVAAGMAQYLNIDPTVVRVLWALTLLPGGIPGLILYIVCWIIIPEEDVAKS
jgi:phage shock protein PspC (stress-responsive transcriptional regulator)